jgi:hydrogenase-4 component E
VSTLFVIAVTVFALAIVIARRRTVAVALVGGQSVALGGYALVHGFGESSALVVGGVLLVGKGVLLPVGLAWVIRRTREPRLIAGELPPLTRATIAAAITLAAVELVPPLGLDGRTAGQGAVALVVLGIVIAVLRRSAVLHAVGFLVAENGVYLAALAAPGGLPAVVEIGLLFDLILVVAVAAAFATRIHDEFGTGDTTLLGSLRD